MIKKWKSLSRADQTRAQILIVSAMIALYAPLYMQSNGKLQEATKLLNRRKDRIEKRAVMNVGSEDLPSERVVNSRIDRAEKELVTLRETFAEQEARFIDIKSSMEQQQLKLEISTLAQQTGMQLKSMSTRTDADGELVIGAVTERPCVVVSAFASYTQWLAFLNGLKELSAYVSVSKFSAGFELVDERKKIYGNRLAIEMELTI